MFSNRAKKFLSMREGKRIYYVMGGSTSLIEIKQTPSSFFSQTIDDTKNVIAYSLISMSLNICEKINIRFNRAKKKYKLLTNPNLNSALITMASE